MKIEDLEMAYEAANSSRGVDEFQVYVSKSTGEIVWDAESLTGEVCPVEDIENNDGYIQIPDKYELDLGQKLVWKFVELEIPEFRNEIHEIFGSRGAYARFKQFLDQKGLLEKWYGFEDSETRAALADWCTQQGIEIKL